jgi:CRP/FNR family cyclic AMP-dependent transcriptional regulator
MNIPELFRDWQETEEFPARSEIFTEGEPADVMYVILSGEVVLTRHGNPLSTEGEGDLIGELAMLKSSTRSCTATASGEVKLARLDGAQLRSLTASNTDFSLHVMAGLANRLRAVDNYISLRIDEG